MTGLGSRTRETPDDDEFQITYETVQVGDGVCVGMGHERRITELEDRCVRAEEALDAARRDGLVAVEVAEQRRERLAAAEEALRQALRYCESYCEATDPDPREDDGEEMSTASAYVLSAMLAIAEGLAAVPVEDNR